MQNYVHDVFVIKFSNFSAMILYLPMIPLSFLFSLIVVLYQIFASITYMILPMILSLWQVLELDGLAGRGE
jgi:hypothetical protein